MKVLAMEGTVDWFESSGGSFDCNFMSQVSLYKIGETGISTNNVSTPEILSRCMN
jgi:hypothetical protein